MNTDIILQFISILLPVINLYFILKSRMDSNYSFLNWRIRKLEKELSCLRTIVRINLPRVSHEFSDEINKSYEEFEKELNEK